MNKIIINLGSIRIEYTHDQPSEIFFKKHNGGQKEKLANALSINEKNRAVAADIYEIIKNLSSYCYEMADDNEELKIYLNDVRDFMVI